MGFLKCPYRIIENPKQITRIKLFVLCFIHWQLGLDEVIMFFQQVKLVK